MAMPGMVVYLLRHSETVSDGVRRYIGCSDTPLSDHGKLRAEQFGSMFATKDISAIYHSPLIRSRDTAILMNPPLGYPPLHVCAELSEICLGDWEGLPFADVQRDYPKAYAARGQDIANFRIPSGESFADCQARVVEAWQEITAQHAGENIIIVGHAGVNRCMLSTLLHQDLAELFSIPQSYLGVSIITSKDNQFVVEQIDGTVV